MTIAENVKRLRAEKGLSQPELAKLAGVSQQLISQIENSKNRTTKHIPVLARVLGVSLDELAPEYAGLIDDDDDDTVLVPFLDKISAGSFKAQDGVREADIDRYMKVSHLPKGDWFALSVDGDSMDRIAPPGSVVIVNRAEHVVSDGWHYIFSLDDGAATFKQYRSEPEPMLVPQSFNANHYAVPVGDRELYIFGRVRRVITDL